MRPPLAVPRVGHADRLLGLPLSYADDSAGRTSSPSDTRLVGVDAVRFIAFCAVVCLHVPKFGQVGLLIEQVSHFAVPFFFVGSGYFAARAPETFRPAFTRMLKRIGPVFLIWLAIYLIADRVSNRDDPNPINVIHWLLTGGPGFHLWFFPSLLMSLTLLYALRRFSWAPLTVLAVLLYGVGLALTYKLSAGGLTAPHWNARNGPFASLIFVVAGYYLAKAPKPPALLIGVGLTVGGLALSLVELQVLRGRADINIHRLDFFLGTVPFGIGCFCLALLLAPSGPSKLLARIGRYGLGLYAMHLLILQALVAMNDPGSNITGLAVAAATVAITTVLCLVLARMTVLRPLLI
ncbi:acyltransferase family protein [soil metagenome]